MKNNRQKRSPHRGGFTLLEVMVVLFILVTMAGLAVVAVQGQRAKAQRQTAFAYVKTLETAINRYDMDVGRPPSQEQGLTALVTPPQDLPNPGAWAGPYIASSATSRDPWGMEYRYVSPGREGRPFEIWSCGPDMVEGTEDDIGSWKGSLD